MKKIFRKWKRGAAAILSAAILGTTILPGLGDLSGLSRLISYGAGTTGDYQEGEPTTLHFGLTCFIPN